MYLVRAVVTSLCVQCGFLVLYASAWGAEPAFTPPVYEVSRAGSPIKIDGRLDEPAWFAAPAFSPFHFTWHQSGTKEQTVAKMLWDNERLYIAHICEDAHLTAKVREHDGNVPQDDCFEVIFAPDPSRPEVYFNIEWNVLGTYVDNFRPNGPKQPRAPRWDVEGIQLAGQFTGTPNADQDQDTSWQMEVAIPWRSFVKYQPHTPPVPGDAWNLNLNRHGGKVNPQYSQWSRADTPVPSFHTPHRFGRVVFTDKVSPFRPAVP